MIFVAGLFCRHGAIHARPEPAAGRFFCDLAPVKKKSPDRIESIRGFPFFILEILGQTFVHEGYAVKPLSCPRTKPSMF
jgi:hypothetical protein